MKAKEKKEGITLIALIITIIVLLVLAGVSISALTGENGVIIKALAAKEMSDMDNSRTTVSLAYDNSLLKVMNSEDVDLVSDMQKTLQQDDEDAEVTGDESHLEAIYDGYVTVIENGKVISTESIRDDSPGDITNDVNGNKLDGTEENPYQIRSIEDFVALEDLVENSLIDANTYITLSRSLNFKSSNSYNDSTRTTLTTKTLTGENLETHTYTQDLLTTLTTGSGWTPIGLINLNSFQGIFNGNNHEIKNMYVDYTETSRKSCFVGLFYKNSGTIKKLTVSGEITAKNIYEVSNGANQVYIGGITGYNYSDGIIDNCTNKSLLFPTFTTQYQTNAYIGGITSGNVGTIQNSVNLGSIKANETQDEPSNYVRIGGIVSYVTAGTISNCSNEGDIKVDNVYYCEIGGVVRSLKNATIFDCYNKGNIKTDNIYECAIGGIDIYLYDSNFENCYNTGNIEMNNVEDFGIIAGVFVQTSYENSLGQIQNCYNTGNITANNVNDCEVGGIVVDSYNVDIQNCYNTGEIILENVTNYYIGGIISGYYNSNLYNSYNTGNIKVSNASDYGYVGGICSYATSNNEKSNIENCYNTGNIEVSNLKNVYAAGIIAYYYNTEMKNCYNAGDIKISNLAGYGYVGGICSYVNIANSKTDYQITNNYNLGKITLENCTSTNYIGGVIGYNDNVSEDVITYNYNSVAGLGGINGTDITGVAETITGLTLAKIKNYVATGTHP